MTGVRHVRDRLHRAFLREAPTVCELGKIAKIPNSLWHQGLALAERLPLGVSIS